MMNNVELFIRDENGLYHAVDIFNDENIQIEDSIQNVRDISKIFNTFTRDFKVPASYENNKLFKHYYNLNINNGFDARVKTRALIKVGGVDYKEGLLTLLSVGMKDNKASHYKLTFQGLITSLKDVLQDDEVGDLDYQDLKFEDNRANRVEGIRYGLYKDGQAETDANGYELYPDIIYAPIFTSGKVVAVPYDQLNGQTDDLPANGALNYGFSLTHFTGIGDTNTLVEKNDDTVDKMHNPVTVFDYKPSIKAGRLIQMISEQYGLNLTEEFYHLEEVDQLYVLYNGKKEESTIANSESAFNGNLGNNTTLGNPSLNLVTLTTEQSLQGDDIALNGTYADSEMYVYNNSYSWANERLRGTITKATHIIEWDSNDPPPQTTITVEKFVRLAGGGEHILKTNVADFTQLVNGEMQMDDEGLDAPYVGSSLYNSHVGPDKRIDHRIRFEGAGDFSGAKVTTSVFTCDEVAFGQLIGESTYDGSTTFFSLGDATLNLSAQAPKLKCLDLLLGMFKMLNLTSYVDSDGTIRVLPLRDFYDEGNTLDITQYVEKDSHQVENGFLYRNVNMKHQEQEDVLSKNFASSQAGVKYGDIKVTKELLLNDAVVTDNVEVVEGKDYLIESPFARMMFENLSLAVDSDNNQTNGIYSQAAGGRLTDMVIGNCIDDTMKGVETKPIIFYGKYVQQYSLYAPSSANPTGISDIGGRVNTIDLTTERGNTAGSIGSSTNALWLTLVQRGATSTNDKDYVRDDELTDELGVNIGAANSGRWWNPSGIMASRYRRDGETLINPYAKFNSVSFDGSQAYDEYEYSNGLPSSEWIVGLYQNNYEDYLSNLYQKSNRISKFKVRLPNNIITSYGLNDTLVIGTNQYNINKIKIDLLSGKGEVELINKIDIPVVELEDNLGQLVRNKIKALNLLPASGNYLYDTSIVTKTFGEPGDEDYAVEYVNTYSEVESKSDAEVALDRMEAEFSNLEAISVIVTWYGDTDGPDMLIKPRLDLDEGSPVYSVDYEVGSYDRTNTPQVTLNAEGKANQGGTPGDAGLLEFVAECNSRGLKVMLYPFLQMDTTNKIWRGQIPFTTETEVDTWWSQYEPFIRHYSQLFASEGIALDKFMIGTELVTLTRFNVSDRYPGVAHLTQLAEDVRNDFGASDPVVISYGANWDEYHSHDGKYHMDELWTSPYIDAVGLDNYFPATDYQQPSTVTYDDIYNGYEQGEGWDHYYTTYNDPTSKVNYSIPGGEFAWKNVFGWWDRNHTAHSYSTTAPPTLGSELLTSADFSSIAWPWNYGSWSYIPSPTVSGGIATLPISGGDYPAVNPRIEQQITTTSGTSYRVEVDVNDAGSIPIQALVVDPNNSFAYLNGDTQTFATNGVITFDFTATSGDSTLQILVQGVDGDSVELNSASIKEITAGGTTTVTNTAWTTRMKPLFFAEYGFASVDGTTNQPNVFAPELPRESSGSTDFDILRQGLYAFNNYWDDKTQGISGFAEDRYAWAYDVRPYPQYPHAGVWDDSYAWEKGHWINGKLV